MGKVNLEKMAQERAKRNAGSKFYDAPEGDTRIYVAAFPREEDEAPYYEFRMHYGLGQKAKSSHMCIEPAVNKVILLDCIQEQLERLKIKLGPCETCERLDRGESVSGDPEQNGKPSSRWLFLIWPHSTRSDARAKFKELPEEIKALSASYRVWDGISDKFGECGDITDMDAATLVRIIREGTKFSTKWEVQTDAETLRKPIKVPDSVREQLAEHTAAGAMFDPAVLLAEMIKSPEDIAKIYAADDKADEYEETTTEAAADAKDGKFKPPGAKGKSQAQVPAGKPETKPASTAKPAASKPATPAKPAQKATSPAAGATKPAQAKGPAKADPNSPDVMVKDIIKRTKKQPPGCLFADPDSEAPICVGGQADDGTEHERCAFAEPCFKKLGVALPDPEPEAEPEAEEATEEAVEEAAGMTVEDCVAGERYQLPDGTVAAFKGPAKGQFYFTLDDGKVVKVPPATDVTAPPDEEVTEEATEEVAEEAEPEADEDTAAAEAAKVAELEASLAKRKAAAGKAKK